eukprot:PhM_4_TR14581/c0_g1_i1/m.41553
MLMPTMETSYMDTMSHLAVVSHAGDPHYGDAPLSELAELKELEQRLFVDVPKELMVRPAPRTSAATPMVQCHNERYRSFEPPQQVSPERIVDVNRPLTPRFSAIDPELRKRRLAGATSLVKAQITAEYTPAPETNPRRMVEARKFEIQSHRVRPAPKPAVSEEAVVQRTRSANAGRRVPRDFVPTCAASVKAPADDMNPRKIIEQRREERLRRFK